MSAAASETDIPVCPSENLPPGWRMVCLGDLGLGRTEGIEPSSEPNTLFELWSVPTFPTGEPERVLGSTIGSNKQRVQEGDVLLCKINPRINRVWKVEASNGLPQIASTEWIVFRSPLFDPAFLMWRFRENTFRAELCANVSGVGGSLTRARPKEVAAIRIPLPPLAEQRRIVARLEALMARSRRARALLAEVPAQLAQARQSILASAFRGDLTADWRKKNKAQKTGNVLLAEAREAHRCYVENHKNGKWLGPQLVDPVPAISLPNTWAWIAGSEVVEPGAEIVYGIVQPGSKLANGVPYVRGTDIQDGRILLNQLLNTSPDIAKRYARSSLAVGDVLLGIIRATKVAVVPAELNGGNITQGTARFRPSSIISTYYLARMLETPDTQSWLHAHYRGIDMPGLNLADVRRVPIPLPPLPEQHEIVRRLNAAFVRLDAAAAAHAAAIAELDRLDQSLLARAFSGGLVPQSDAVVTAVSAASSSRSTFKPKSYLTQLVPALLRVHGRPLVFDQINSALALLHSPRAARDRVFRELGALEARKYFIGWSQAHEDGALTAAIDDLLKTGTLSQTKDRKGLLTIHLVGKLPPTLPEVETDARHIATFIDHISTRAPNVAPASVGRIPSSGPRSRGQTRPKNQTPV